jgi:hypothetical protein
MGHASMITEEEAMNIATRLGLRVASYTTDGHPELTEWIIADEDGDPVDWEALLRDK